MALTFQPQDLAGTCPRCNFTTVSFGVSGRCPHCAFRERRPDPPAPARMYEVLVAERKKK